MSRDQTDLILRGSRLRIRDGGFAENGENVGESSIGNPDFASVENVVGSGFVELGASADGRSVRSTRRLRQRERREFTTWRQQQYGDMSLWIVISLLMLVISVLSWLK